MLDIASAKRKNDAVITITQDNSSKKIIILSLNHAAEKLTGYMDEELKDKDLQNILPKEVNQDIASYVEFEDNGNDIANVLTRIMNFSIINKDGNKVPSSIKVFHVFSENNSPRYEILLRDITLLEKIEELKQQIITQYYTPQEKQAISSLGLKALEQSITLTQKFIDEYGIDASFAAIGIDKLETWQNKYGDEVKESIITETNKLINSSHREEDVFAKINDSLFGIVLIECTPQEAQIVLNRIRTKIESSPIYPFKDNKEKPMHITTSFGICEINGNTKTDVIIDLAVKKLKEAMLNGGNRIGVNAS